MKLSIITINRNNAAGLEKTLQSVNAQSCKEFEHIIVDGASTDNSVEIIQRFNDVTIQRRWISEPDKGIYNAMNKGISMSNGVYLHFLNSGDYLENSDVCKDIYKELKDEDIIIGNVVTYSGQKRKEWHLKREISFNLFYNSTLPHTSAYIKKALFDKYGYYDESLQIVSDWKFYLIAVGLNDASVRFVNMFISVFDEDGISNTRHDLESKERRLVLRECLPNNILKDYDQYRIAICQAETLKRHKFLNRVLYLFERCLNKLDNLQKK